MDVHGALLVEGLAALTLSAGFTTILRIEAVDGLREDAGTGGLADAARTAEQIGMGQLAGTNSVLERGSQRPLTHNRVKVERTIFKCRNNVFFHLERYDLLCAIYYFVQRYKKK